jgi:hypothetical protein
MKAGKPAGGGLLFLRHMPRSGDWLMQRSILLMLVLAWLPSAWCMAAEPFTKSPKGENPIPQATPKVSIFTQNTGGRVLQIDYPWQAYKKASVEVWLVTENSPAFARVKPLNFVNDRLNGETSVKVGQCLAAAYGVGLTQSIPGDRVNYKIVGCCNSLGKPAVSIVGKSKEDMGTLEDKGKSPKTKEKQQDTEQEPPLPFGAWAAFCDLENWSANRHELSLDLSPDHFAKPGKLYVWFLRGDTMLWEERLDWKGY